MMNGCGPKWLPKILKDLFFNWWYEDLCNQHDIAYTQGGTDRERRVADNNFLNGMLLSIVYLRWYVKPFAVSQALFFYLIVRLLGWTRFNYIKNYKE